MVKEQGSEGLLETLWGSRVFSHGSFTCQDAFCFFYSCVHVMITMINLVLLDCYALSEFTEKLPMEVG